MLSGRDFTQSDVSGHPRVAIVSESMARHYFGTREALGKHFGIARDEGAPIEVVGVVRDAKDGSLRDDGVDMMYLPYRQGRLTQMRVVVRATGDPRLLVPQVRTVLHELAPQLPITKVAPISEEMRRSIVMEQFTAVASACFGAVALLLAALGIFAVTSHAVVTRTREIGVRMALGGSPGHVIRMIVRGHSSLVGLGLAAGFLVAAAVARATSSLMFGVSPWDPASYAGAFVVTIATAAAGVSIPAWRASRIDPAQTLRYE
jgi:putative ABC transport system permease protein